MTTPAPTPEDIDAIYGTARKTDPDRFAAALLAPRAVRDDLVALAAFAGDIKRIPQLISEAHMGEIRLQWWRDALADGAKGVRSGNPVADVFASVVHRHGLNMARIDDHLDAYAHALYADPPADTAALHLEVELKDGVLFECAATILGVLAGQHVEDITTAARAYGMTMLALGLPYALARGRSPLPGFQAPDLIAHRAAQAALAPVLADVRMHMAQIRPRFQAYPRPLRTALLPLALVEPYLAALEKPDHDPAHDVDGIAPLTRMTRLALAHWRGRL